MLPAFQYNRNKAKNQALIRQPVSEKYLQLGMDNAPIPAFSYIFYLALTTIKRMIVAAFWTVNLDQKNYRIMT